MAKAPAKNAVGSEPKSMGKPKDVSNPMKNMGATKRNPSAKSK